MEANAESKERNPRKKLNSVQYYLLFYNFASAVGWLAVLLITHKTLKSYKSNKDLLTAKDLYTNAGYLLRILLTTSLLEVLHAALKLVRSNPVLNLIQTLARLIVVLVIVDRFEPVKNSVGVLMVSLAWSISESVRYSYYAFYILDFVPYVMTWCRYSLFIVLYPIGVVGELTCVYYAIQHVIPIKNRDQYSLRLPNQLNFSFDALIWLCIAVVCYLPGFPLLYKHMLSQRKKVLNPKKKSN